MWGELWAYGIVLGGKSTPRSSVSSPVTWRMEGVGVSSPVCVLPLSLDTQDQRQRNSSISCERPRGPAAGRREEAWEAPAGLRRGRAADTPPWALASTVGEPSALHRPPCGALSLRPWKLSTDVHLHILSVCPGGACVPAQVT